MKLGNVLVLFCAAILASCGGGTSGTGSPSTTSLNGYVHDFSGTAMQGVFVTVSETGDTAVTDKNGNFQISTSLTGGSIHLFLSTDDFDDTAVITGIPSEAKEILLDLSVDVAAENVVIESIRILPENEPEAVETPVATLGPDRPTATPVALRPRKSQVNVRGTLIDRVNEPVPDTVVKLLEPRAISRSNESGKFRMKVEIREAQMRFVIEKEDYTGRVTIKNLPLGRDFTVEVVFSLPLMPPGVEPVEVPHSVEVVSLKIIEE